MIGGLGVGVGLIVANLMNPKSAQAAPGTPAYSDSDIRQALAALLLSSQEINNKLDSLSNIQAALQILANVPTTPLPGVDKPVALFDKVINVASPLGGINTDKLFDWKVGRRLLIKIESTLNQPVIIQVIGNVFNSFDQVVDINGPFNVLPGSNASVGLAWDDWHPYIAVNIAVGVAPTNNGRLKIYVSLQP